MNKIIIFISALLIPFTGCKDEYDITLRPSNQSILVVEGILNSGPGSTTIVLSRVLNLKDTTKNKLELNAQLIVEGKDNTSYPLNETSPGNYTHNQLPLTAGKEYRLKIRTSNGKEYRSDYVLVKKTPVIDSIVWKKENTDIGIYLNTHDPSGQTKYYRWEYDETWEINSHYYAEFKFIPPETVVPISFNESNYRCWKQGNYKGILLGSSAQLQDDVIFEAPLLRISRGSDKFSVRYSILVKQYALSKQAYEFLNLMKKNTESLGSIFDAQPSELRGNIHCDTDPQELVIGFITASSFEEKRLFITRFQAESYFRLFCETDTIPNHPDTIKAFMPSFLPWTAIYGRGLDPISYLISTAECVDCTTRGGDTTRPRFW